MNIPMSKQDKDVLINRQTNQGCSSNKNDVDDEITSNIEEHINTEAFTQLINNSSYQFPISMDKKQLYQTVIHFQKELKNSQNPIQETTSTNSHMSQYEYKSPHRRNGNNPIDSLEDSPFKSKPKITRDNDSNTKSFDNSRNYNGREPLSQQDSLKINRNQKNTNFYDEIPIKPAAADFIELVEQNLANDIINEEPLASSSGKKKALKSGNSRIKKTIPILKPVKNEKKYFYYTDILDENGKVIEDKRNNRTQKQDNQFNNTSSMHSTLKQGDIIQNNEKLGANSVNGGNETQRLLSVNQSDKIIIKKNKKSNSQELQPKSKRTNNKTPAVASHINFNLTYQHKIKPKEKDLKIATNNKIKSTQPKKITIKTKTSNKNVNKSIEEQYENKPPITDNINSPINETIKQDQSPEIDFTALTNNTLNKFLQQEVEVEENTCEIKDEVCLQDKLIKKEEAINKKIDEIDCEIVHFRKEKNKVDKIKDEYERLHSSIQVSINQYNTNKSDWEEWKEEETKKIQQEKKKIMNDIKQISSIKQLTQDLQVNNKKDKEMIDTLKNQIPKIQAELKQRDHFNKVTIDKLKRQLEDLEIKTIQQQQNDANHQKSLSQIAANDIQENSIKISTNQNMASSFNNKTNNSNSVQKNKKILKTTKPSPKPKGEIKQHNIPYKATTAQSNQSNSTPTKMDSKNSPPDPRKQLKIPKLNKLIHNESTKDTITATNLVKEEFSDTYDFVLPERYHLIEYHLLNQETSADGKIIRLYDNDKREIVFQSGVRKEMYKDGYQIVYFSNGDLKQIFPDNKSVYYFKDAKTIQTSFDDGLQVFKFYNGQIEKHYPDGGKRISFPDGSIRNITKDGSEETFYADGTIHRTTRSDNGANVDSSVVS